MLSLTTGRRKFRAPPKLPSAAFPVILAGLFYYFGVILSHYWSRYLDMMNFLNWFILPVKNQYADFTGRTTRQQFWMYVLVYIIISIAFGIITGILQADALMWLFDLALFVPSIAITARRLHDVGKSGWWQLIGIIPILGWIVLIVFLVGKGESTANKDGMATVTPTATAWAGIDTTTVSEQPVITPTQAPSPEGQNEEG